jgi:hypothetical protein
MLQVRETRVERSRYPVIDFHTHITVSAHEVNGVALAAERTYLSDPKQLIAVMDRKHIRAMVNLTGGFDAGLVETIRRYDKAHPGRFSLECRTD